MQSFLERVECNGVVFSPSVEIWVMSMTDVSTLISINQEISFGLNKNFIVIEKG